jgi:hypothetical protein
MLLDLPDGEIESANVIQGSKAKILYDGPIIDRDFEVPPPLIEVESNLALFLFSDIEFKGHIA